MIAVVGSVNLDIVARVDRHPRGGETLMADSHETAHGGKGANQAVAAARLGAPVAFVGCVGTDAAGEELAQGLVAEGIDIGLLRSTASPTGTALIVLDSEGENTIVVAAGANADVAIGDEEAAFLGGADILVCQLEIPLPTVIDAMDAASGVVILNAAPAADLPDEAWERIDYLIVNEHELELTLGKATHDAVRERGLTAVITTLGADGARVVTASDVGHVPAPSVSAIDTTGAGDAFCGAFATGLHRGLDVFQAAAEGVHVGALATTKVGARRGMPSSRVLDEFMGRAG